MAKDDVIPDGACTRSGDQVAVAPGSLEYMKVTFNIDALTEALGDKLDELGYTLRLSKQPGQEKDDREHHQVKDTKKVDQE